MRETAAIDIKAARISEGVNRLDPNYLRQGRANYAVARSAFLRGEINSEFFVIRLQALGYRADALKAEIKDAEHDKNNPAKPMRFFQ